MPPLEPQNNNEVELEAILLENQSQSEILDDIRATNEAQVVTQTQGNEELRELNSSVDIIIEKMNEPKTEVQKVELIGAEFITIKGKDFKYEDFTEEQIEALKVKGDEGYTPIKGKDYFTEKEVSTFKKEVTPVKGKDYKDGDDYILTAKDKKEIAKSIKVPVVEKVIERTEVVIEKPIIKEVAINETPDALKQKILEVGLSFKDIKDTPDID